MGTFSAYTEAPAPQPWPPSEITVEGRRVKLTPRQWQALVRATRHEHHSDVFPRALVEQLDRKGLGTAMLSSLDAYRRYEWNRQVGPALYPFRPFPAVREVVTAMLAARDAARRA